MKKQQDATFSHFIEMDTDDFFNKKYTNTRITDIPAVIRGSSKSLLKLFDQKRIFINCYFENCTFDGIMSELTFKYCIFENCKFENVASRFVRFQTCIINKVTLTDCSIRIIELDLVRSSENYRVYIFALQHLLHEALEEYNSDANGEIIGCVRDINEQKRLKNKTYKIVPHKKYLNSLSSFINEFDIRGNEYYNTGHTPIVFNETDFSNEQIAILIRDKHVLVDPYIKEIPTGEIIGFKLVRNAKNNMCCPNTPFKYYIAKLLIPEDARRSCALGSKCRCDKATVLAIYPIKHIDIGENDSNKDDDFYYIDTYQKSIERGYIKSNNRNIFVSPFSYYLGYDFVEYRVGRGVSVDDFDDNRYIECSNGIHFFLTLRDLYTQYDDDLSSIFDGSKIYGN